MSYVRYAALLLWFLSPTNASASLLDRGHAHASRWVGDVADGVDRFFVDENADEANNETRVRIGGGVEIVDGEGLGVDSRFRLDLHLPRTSRRLTVVLIGSDADHPLRDALGQEDDDTVAGFLRYFLLDRDAAWLSLDGGTKFRPEPDPFGRIRGVRRIAVGDLLSITPRQTFYWELADGFGETTRVDVDRQIGERSLLRWRSEGTWSEVSEGVDLFMEVSGSRQLAELRGIRAAVKLDGRTEPSVRATRYAAAIRYRHAVWRDWLFGEIEPEIGFPLDRDWTFTPGITLRLEAILGGPPQ